MTTKEGIITKEEMGKMKKEGEFTLKVIKFLETNIGGFYNLQIIVDETKLSFSVVEYILRNTGNIEKIVFAGEFCYGIESDAIA